MKKGIGLGWSVFRKQDKMLKVSPVVLKAKGLQPVLSLSHDKGADMDIDQVCKEN